MKDILLPEPQKEGGMSLREALSSRRSTRSYSDREIPLQTLSNLLWAGWGLSHGGGTLRTAPSSHNRQEMDLYVFLSSGVYIYDAAAGALRQILQEDLRGATCIQEYAFEAPLQIAMISDTSKITGKTPEGVIEAVSANAAYISENLYLACAAEGLSTVARLMVPFEQLHKVLSLRPEQRISIVQTVGYYQKK